MYELFADLWRIVFSVDFAVVVGRCVFSVAFVMNIVPLLIWAERKGAAYIQDRPGPNRAYIGLPHPMDTPRVLMQLAFGKKFIYEPYVSIRAAGLVHTLNDVVKLVFKEDIIPGHVEKFYWFLAPIIAMSVALCTFSVVPFGDSIMGHSLVVSDMDGGLLFVLAATSLGVYGIMLAGWSSNNKFSLLGGLRSSAQMVSYELAMGLSAVVVFLGAGSVSLLEIVRQQSGPLWNWNVFSPWGALAFILFWISAFAETNRTPFDLPEGEAELVAGYHTEYSSLRFALFFMAEYANMIVASAVTATLFFGGYSIPFVTGDFIRANTDVLVGLLGLGAVPALIAFAWLSWAKRNRPFYLALPEGDARAREPLFWSVTWAGLAGVHLLLAGAGFAGVFSSFSFGPDLVAAVLHVSSLGVKVLIGCWVFIWVRWTIPRFRYDQLMNLGWKYMLPIALINVFVTASWIALTHS